MTEQKNDFKPPCQLVGEDGNIFCLTSIASATLKEHDMGEQAIEMYQRIKQASSYDEALGIIAEYVDVY